MYKLVISNSGLYTVIQYVIYAIINIYEYMYIILRNKMVWNTSDGLITLLYKINFYFSVVSSFLKFVKIWTISNYKL